MALQVVTSFGTIDPDQLWNATFLQELFQNSASAVIGSVTGSTILTAASVLNTHLADDAVDARVWKDTEAGFVCAGLTINGTLTLTTLTQSGTATFNGDVVLGSNGSDTITFNGVPSATFITARSAVSVFDLGDTFICERSSVLRKGTITQLAAGVRSYLIIAEDQTAGQVPVGGWNNRNITHLPTSFAGVSLATNVLTLPAGYYRVRISAETRDITDTVLRLVTVSGTTLVMGTNNGFVASHDQYAPRTSVLEGEFTLATSDQVRIQQWAGGFHGAPSDPFGYISATVGGTQHVMRAVFEFWYQ